MCELFRTVRTVLPAEPSSVPLARRLITEHPCSQQDADSRDRAALLVSELVTNALRHGEPPIELEVSCDDDHALRVRVSDAGPGTPRVRRADLTEEGGRGLAITDLLSDEWGVDPGEAGKTVWFRLRPSSPAG